MLNIRLINFINSMNMSLEDIDIYRGQIKLQFSNINDLRRHWQVPVRSFGIENGRFTIHLVTAPYLYMRRNCWDGFGMYIGHCCDDVGYNHW